MQGLRIASTPRVWAKSRQHGPTNYDGPALEAKPGGRMRRLTSGERQAPGAWIPLVIALAFGIVGWFAPNPDNWVFWVFGGVIGSSALAKRGERLAYLGLVCSAALLLFLLWARFGHYFL